MSLPTAGETAETQLAPRAGQVLTRVDWAPVPRVNLLPPEITAGRQLRAVQRWLAVGVVVTVLAGVGATWWAQNRVDDAQQQLDTVQAQAGSLNRQKAAYAEVPKINQEIDQAQLMRESAMATHVLWYQYLNDLAQSTPAEVTLSAMTAQVAGGAAQSAPAAANDPLAPAGIGGVAFTGTAESYPDVAKWMESMDSVVGFANSSISQAAKEPKSGTITFTGNVTMTQKALSHAYDRKKS